jgi:hypothetical protein
MSESEVSDAAGGSGGGPVDAATTIDGKSRLLPVVMLRLPFLSKVDPMVPLRVVVPVVLVVRFLLVEV